MGHSKMLKKNSNEHRQSAKEAIDVTASRLAMDQVMRYSAKEANEVTASRLAIDQVMSDCSVLIEDTKL